MMLYKSRELFNTFTISNTGPEAVTVTSFTDPLITLSPACLALVGQTIAIGGSLQCVTNFYLVMGVGTTFTNTSLVAVDFMVADLSEVVFENCDLYRSEFDKAIANKTNFKTSFNYTINPEKTKIKKAIFSLEGVKGLLYKYDIIVK